MHAELTAHPGALTVRHESPRQAGAIVQWSCNGTGIRGAKGVDMTEAVVSLKGIVKRYVRGKQRVQVLHGIDLQIRAGEFLALMGPSGIGKNHVAQSDRRHRSCGSG